MALIVSFVSQKGGVGKTTLARALAVMLTQTGQTVRIADLDEQQLTALAWSDRRKELEVEPFIDVRSYKDAGDALVDAGDVDVLILDGPARASGDTKLIAENSHIVVQPTSGVIDDLSPAAALFQVLTDNNIPKERLIIALSRVDADSEEREGRKFFESLGYRVLEGHIRNRRSYGHAMNQGGSILETIYDSLNTRSNVLLDDLVGVIVANLRQSQQASQPQKKNNQTKRGHAA